MRGHSSIEAIIAHSTLVFRGMSSIAMSNSTWVSHDIVHVYAIGRP